MSRLPALLFDLDGTLVDSAVTIALALAELSTTRGGKAIDAAMVRPLVSKGASILVREALGAVAGDPAEDLAAFRAILADLPADKAIIFPGAVDALIALADHPCAIVTNKPEGLARHLLGQLDLLRFFEAVIGGDTLPVCKPDPAPLRLALSKLDADDRSVMIGDSAIDVATARAAGTAFFLFEGGYGPVDTEMSDVHRRFGQFEELPLLVQDVMPSLLRQPAWPKQLASQLPAINETPARTR